MNLIAALKEYLHASKSEMQKIAWPSRQETIRYTTLVVAVCVIVAAFFATLDFGLDKAVQIALTAKESGRFSKTNTSASDNATSPVKVVPLNGDPNAANVIPGLKVQTNPKQ